VPGKHPISEANVPPNQRQGGYDNGPTNYVQDKKVDKQDRQDRRLPFGQEPFNLAKQNDGMEEENKNDKQHYVYVPSRREKEKQNPDKDPDVWDPPSPKVDRGKWIARLKIFIFKEEEVAVEQLSNLSVRLSHQEETPNQSLSRK